MAISNTGGWRNIANTKKQIRSPNDVNGLKIRTIKADVQIELVKAIGGNPTPISWPEVYTSLATEGSGRDEKRHHGYRGNEIS